MAVTRGVSPSMADCELTFSPRVPIDIEGARTQHRAYEECLERLGCRVIQLASDPRLPDSVFIEDTAVVLNEIAIMAHSGARSRRAETKAVSQEIARHRKVTRIKPPATLDGGDVLVVGRSVFVGLSRRTNQAGLKQMDSLLTPLGYRVTGVPVLGALHLKSAVTQVADRTLLVNRNWTDASVFERTADLIDVAPGEPHAANALLVGDVVVYPAAHPQTRHRLDERGIKVMCLDISDLAKAEGGVTCCSLIFRETEGVDRA